MSGLTFWSVFVRFRSRRGLIPRHRRGLRHPLPARPGPPRRRASRRGRRPPARRRRCPESPCADPVHRRPVGYRFRAPARQGAVDRAGDRRVSLGGHGGWHRELRRGAIPALRPARGPAARNDRFAGAARRIGRFDLDRHRRGNGLSPEGRRAEPAGLPGEARALDRARLPGGRVGHRVGRLVDGALPRAGRPAGARAEARRPHLRHPARPARRAAARRGGQGAAPAPRRPAGEPLRFRRVPRRHRVLRAPVPRRAVGRDHGGALRPALRRLAARGTRSGLPGDDHDHRPARGPRQRTLDRDPPRRAALGWPAAQRVHASRGTQRRGGLRALRGPRAERLGRDARRRDQPVPRAVRADLHGLRRAQPERRDRRLPRPPRPGLRRLQRIRARCALGRPLGTGRPRGRAGRPADRRGGRGRAGHALVRLGLRAGGAARRAPRTRRAAARLRRGGRFHDRCAGRRALARLGKAALPLPGRCRGAARLRRRAVR